MFVKASVHYDRQAACQTMYQVIRATIAASTPRNPIIEGGTKGEWCGGGEEAINLCDAPERDDGADYLAADDE